MQLNETVLPAPRPGRLRRDTAASDYDRQGYLIIPDALSAAMMTAVRAEATAICRGLRGDIDGVSPAPARTMTMLRFCGATCASIFRTRFLR